MATGERLSTLMLARRSGHLVLAVTLWATGLTASAEPPAPRDHLWVTERHLPSLAIFGVGVGVMAGLRLSKILPRDGSSIGPEVDPATGALLEPDRRGEVDNEYRPNTVSTTELLLFAAGAGLTGVLGSGLGPCDAGSDACRRNHQLMFDGTMSLLETIGSTALVTESLKYIFARPRPDFLDRFEKEGCLQDPHKSACIAGRLSFPSGHASIAFATATWASLMIGGRWVWGRDAREHGDAASITTGIVGQTLLLGTATWIASTRVSDNRHNPSDVIVGGLIGVAMANLSYWTTFTLDGDARLNGGRPGPKASATPVRGGLMLTYGGYY